MKNELIKINGVSKINGKEIKVIEGGFGKDQKCMLYNDIATQHNVEPKYINKLINLNINRFNNNDLIDLCNENFKFHAKNLGLIRSNGQKYCYLLSERGYSKLANIMVKDAKISNTILKDYFNSNIIPEPTNTKEYYFYELLKEQLKALDIEDVKIQHKVLNYKVDLYLPELNIAIEYDENNHKHYTYKQHEGRQLKIEKELGCRFIRVSDEYSIEYASALVLKEITKRMVA